METQGFSFTQDNNIHSFDPFYVSVSYIFLTLLLASLIRKVSRIYLNSSSFSHRIVLEFVATIELCAICFELMIVSDTFGILYYASFFFLLTIWWSMNWQDESACPYIIIEDLIEGTTSFKTSLYIVLAQLVAGTLTHRYVYLLWSFEFAKTHQNRTSDQCTADLQVNMILGAAIECFLTCLCRLVSKTLSTVQPTFSIVLDSLFSTLMVVLAFNYSGGYFNPILASSLKYGCNGNTFLEHIVVYWIGACVGSLMALFIFRLYISQKYCKISKKE